MDLQYHYTSLEALKGIIGNENICFWATRYDKLNDPNEFVWAKKYVVPKILKYADKHNIPFDKDYKMYPYIISFSEYSDNLTMWRLYGNNGLGIQLGFDWYTMGQNTLKRINPDYLMFCAYANLKNLDEQIATTLNIYEQQYSTGTCEDLYNICAFIKKEDYEVEGEIRIIRPNYDYIEMTPETYDTAEWIENPEEIKFRERNGETIPYQEVLFPKESLKEIVVGCQYEFEDIKEYLNILLDKNGYDNSKIVIQQSAHKYNA